MKATTGFFQEKAGENSATRLIFVIGSIWTMGMCIYFALHGTEPAVILAFFAGSSPQLITNCINKKRRMGKKRIFMFIGFKLTKTQPC